MLNLKDISKIFLDFLDGTLSVFEPEDQLSRLIRLNMETNRKIWDLEDSARMTEFGLKHMVAAKQEINKNNQIRNDLIKEIDTEIVKQMDVSHGLQKQFCSESPGMIIDRLAVLFIKLSVIRDLLPLIREKKLQEEYREKENIILRQINIIGNFLDSYLSKLLCKEVFFEIQQPVRLYNDKRIRKYIGILKKKRFVK